MLRVAAARVRVSLQERLEAKKAARRAELEKKQRAEAEELRRQQEAEAREIQLKMEQRQGDDAGAPAREGSSVDQARKTQQWRGHLKLLMKDRNTSSPEAEQAWEKEVLGKALEGGFIEADNVNEAVEFVMKERQQRDMSRLFTAQFREKADHVKTALGKAFEANAVARKQILDTIEDVEERMAALQQQDIDFALRQSEIQRDVMKKSDEAHQQAQVDLQHKQLMDRMSMVGAVAPEAIRASMATLSDVERDDAIEKLKKRFEDAMAERLAQLAHEHGEEEKHARAVTRETSGRGDGASTAQEGEEGALQGRLSVIAEKFASRRGALKKQVAHAVTRMEQELRAQPFTQVVSKWELGAAKLLETKEGELTPREKRRRRMERLAKKSLAAMKRQGEDQTSTLRQEESRRGSGLAEVPTVQVDFSALQNRLNGIEALIQDLRDAQRQASVGFGELQGAGVHSAIAPAEMSESQGVDSGTVTDLQSQSPKLQESIKDRIHRYAIAANSPELDRYLGRMHTAAMSTATAPVDSAPSRNPGK